MKKLVLSLLGAATLAISSNALALNTNVAYHVNIQRGAGRVFVGTAMFQFDSDLPPGTILLPPTHTNPAVVVPFPGACDYDMVWYDAALLPLASECFIAEQKTHGSQSCLLNSTMGVTSMLSVDPSQPCSGFDWFQNIDVVQQISLGEMFSVGTSPALPNRLEGVIQFASPILGNSVFGIEFAG